VLVSAAVGVPVCMSVGLRVLRGLGRGFALPVGLFGGGLPPRRCAVTVSGGIDRAKALAVAAAASNTARRILGSVVAVAAASAAACRAAASALSARLCCWTLEFLASLSAGSGPVAAKALAALAGWPLPLSLVLAPASLHVGGTAYDSFSISGRTAPQVGKCCSLCSSVLPPPCGFVGDWWYRTAGCHDSLLNVSCLCHDGHLYPPLPVCRDRLCMELLS
jgi:hypothetical protein